MAPHVFQLLRYDVTLPDNKPLAEIRLKCLKSKLCKDPDMHQKYTQQMEDYIQKGYASHADEQSAEGRTWYLPHHGVTSAAKPGKVRVVFDAAAKYRGTSLNDNLVQGPDLVNSLVGVLIRFRQEPVALVGDIEAMFHQVKVSDPDRDALRFLWWKHGNLDGPVEVYRMNSHVFGAKSSPSCAAYALKKTAADQQGNYEPSLIKAVNRNFYVDDLLTSTTSVSEAVNLVTGLRSLLHKGGFKLKKWASNSRDVLAAVPEAERAPALISLDLHDDLSNDRALGVYWDIEEDCFTFKTKEDDKQLTRRGILSMVASLFDPLGLVAPTAWTPSGCYRSFAATTMAGMIQLHRWMWPRGYSGAKSTCIWQK